MPFTNSNNAMHKQLLTLGLAAISAAALAQVPTTVPTDGLQSYYNFQNNRTDHVSSYNLQVAGTTGTYAESRPGAGNAYTFNGFNYLERTDYPMPSGNFTIAAWVNNSVAQADGHLMTIAELDESIFLRWRCAFGGLAFHPQVGYYNNLGAWEIGTPNMTVANPMNEWLHLALVKRTNTFDVYVNGILAFTDTDAAPAVSSEAGLGLKVGAGTNGGDINPIKYHNGLMDDLFIYTRDLSNAEIQALYNAVDPDPACDLGTIILTAGTDICANDQETTFFQAGTGGTPSYIRYVSNGGTGGPAGGDMSFSSINHPHVISQVQQSYPNDPLVGSWLVSAFDPNNPSTCFTAPVEVNFLPVGDASCYECNVGLVIGDGETYCPYEYVLVQSWGSASTNQGGSLTFELIPLEGQGDGIPLTTYVYPVYNNFSIPANHSFQGQYRIELKMYYAGESVPCATESVTINFLPADDVQCTCEIGNLLVDNGTVICPGETVTILEAGSVQLPIGRDLRFEIYDYPDYATYYEEQIPFDAPYTFTHDGTYFGEAVFYVYAGYFGGGGGMTPADLNTRGGGNDICGSYEVFVTLAQSTDAACLGVGISNLEGAAISVQPNPTSGLVQLVGTAKGDIVEVTDMTGRIIGSTTLVSDNGTIDLTAMPSGLYLLRTAGGVFKVVKN